MSLLAGVDSFDGGPVFVARGAHALCSSCSRSAKRTPQMTVQGHHQSFARHGTAGHGKARHGRAGQGWARQGKARAFRDQRRTAGAMARRKSHDSRRDGTGLTGGFAPSLPAGPIVGERRWCAHHVDMLEKNAGRRGRAASMTATAGETATPLINHERKGAANEHRNARRRNRNRARSDRRHNRHPLTMASPIP